MKQIPVSPLTWLPEDAITLGESSELPSETTPDMALSLGELISRHTRGLPVPGNGNPVYDDDNDFPDLARMDEMELVDFRRDLQDFIEEQKERWESAHPDNHPVDDDTPVTDPETPDTPDTPGNPRPE